VRPFSDEYVLRFGGYMKSDGNAVAGAVIYKNGVEVWSKYMFVNVRLDPVEMSYHGLILGLKHLFVMNVVEVQVESDDYQVIENMEIGLRGHLRRVMRLHNYAESLSMQFTNINYEQIGENANRYIIQICKNIIDDSETELKN
jgi:ribonuclease HI